MITQKEIDHGWEKIKKEHKFKEIELKVGLFGSGSEPKNNPAYLGLVQQYGANIKVTPKMRGFLRYIGIFLKQSTKKVVIPKRPFVSNAFDKNESKIKSFIKREYGKVLDGKQSFNQFLKRVGVYHEGQMKSSITKFNYRPLHPITIERKKSSRPLIGRGGQMRNSIKYKVKKK